MSDKYSFLDNELKKRHTNNQFRSLKSFTPSIEKITVTRNEKQYINFSSNDYLDLAAHPKVIRRSQKYLEKFGAGSTASRLITGTFDIHRQFEEDIATALNREAALVFNSGFQANSSILGTVADRHSLILADKLSHNSLLQGSLSSRAAFQRYDHNDTEHLESLLQKAKDENYNRIWIVTESVFSMDGDRAPLDQISLLADEYDSLLFVDDAHAVGVWGAEGMGLAKNNHQTDILLGTCGKAFGSFGAYVACSQKMKDYLINFCPGFIYTTALPPAVIGATQAALEIIPTMDNERSAYHQKIESFRKSVQNLGFDTGLSSTQIIPIIIGNEKDTIELANYIEQRRILVTAIRPPTVPAKSSRLRLTLSAGHTDTHLKTLIDALKSWKNG